jgi:hypothetical protein
MVADFPEPSALTVIFGEDVSVSVFAGVPPLPIVQLPAVAVPESPKTTALSVRAVSSVTVTSLVMSFVKFAVPDEPFATIPFSQFAVLLQLPDVVTFHVPVWAEATSTHEAATAKTTHRATPPAIR